MRKVSRECRYCGQAYMARSYDGRGYCSRACAARDPALPHPSRFKPTGPATPPYRLVWFRSCVWCARPFVARTDKVVACSRTCGCEQAKAQKRHRYVKQRVALMCVVCGHGFESHTSRARYCSATCARSVRRNHEDRARHAGVEYERVIPLRVFERDGWRCQICGKATPTKRRGSRYSNAPELDHRVPIAAGGSHTYGNVQCACRACNHEKGASVVVGQLPLGVGAVSILRA